MIRPCHGLFRIEDAIACELNVALNFVVVGHQCGLYLCAMVCLSCEMVPITTGIGYYKFSVNEVLQLRKDNYTQLLGYPASYAGTASGSVKGRGTKLHPFQISAWLWVYESYASQISQPCCCASST